MIIHGWGEFSLSLHRSGNRIEGRCVRAQLSIMPSSATIKARHVCNTAAAWNVVLALEDMHEQGISPPQGLRRRIVHGSGRPLQRPGAGGAHVPGAGGEGGSGFRGEPG